MKRWLIVPGLLAALLALSACAAEEKATPPPATPVQEGRPAWEEEWGRVLAAAKQEGKVAVTAAAVGAESRRALTEPFEKAYGIKVELVLQTGSELIARVKTERAAGQYLWDVSLGGHTPILLSLKPEGLLDPVEPALIRPEVKEGKNWLGGELAFVDKDHMGLTSVSYSGPALYINTNLVKPEEITSFRDLLDPKWKGKIVSTDPKVVGSGQSTYALLYVTGELGLDFLRQLVKQQVVFLRDKSQPPEMLAQGKFPICLGCDPAEIRRLREQGGLPVRPLDPRQVKEGGAFLSGGSGVIALFNKAPHPNAAKVYINWFLSKEGQAEYGRSQGYPSRRLDVPNGDWTIPEMLPDVRFWNSYTEEGAAVAGRLPDLVKEVFGE